MRGSREVRHGRSSTLLAPGWFLSQPMARWRTVRLPAPARRQPPSGGAAGGNNPGGSGIAFESAPFLCGVGSSNAPSWTGGAPGTPGASAFIHPVLKKHFLHTTRKSVRLSSCTSTSCYLQLMLQMGHLLLSFACMHSPVAILRRRCYAFGSTTAVILFLTRYTNSQMRGLVI
jgi:hypothetical protein